MRPLSSIQLQKVIPPAVWHDVPSVILSDETLHARKEKVLSQMRSRQLATLIIYGDKEHSGNFEYLTGFIPRFEEALLVLHSDGEAVLVLGNENLKLAAHARLANRVIHAPWFSLPNQPMDNLKSLPALLADAGVVAGRRYGLVGWKLFTGVADDTAQMFELPAFIVDALRQAAGEQAQFCNATGIFISPDGGVRTVNNANELAHYEYGANLASTAVLTALSAIEPGKTEKQIGARLAAEGQPNNVVMIAATGERFAHANLYPGDKVIQRGDKFSLTTSFKGGLSSRAAYVVADESELAPEVADYLDVVAKPYYRAVVSWLENLRIGMCGSEMYALIEQVLPKAEYHWHLNPGHLVADEEWLCSPIDPHSAAQLRSGMILQIDIIPSRAGYAGASIEDTVALADKALRDALAQDYPELWQRVVIRRRWIQQQLGIRLPDEVLPFSNTVGYLRPWLLDHARALVCV
ncbi:M24 family metallopeptidase [Citrobacter amalonaticus]|uniref:M24 family metallopeptidase n=1 Tax=Citrobacter amalonaticus TaxID=35703 RepID=UPI0035B69759